MLNGRLDDELSRRYFYDFEELIARQQHANAWHTPLFVRRALSNIADFLISIDKEVVDNSGIRVAVIHDGITPLDGFETVISVLLSGCCYVGKLAENDKRLILFLCNILKEIDPLLTDRIEFAERLSKFDFVIFSDQGNATLNEYLKKHNHLLMKSQHAVALVDGNETQDELSALCDDILLYFGQGNLAVKKIFVPENYDFAPLFETLNAHFPELASHHHYLNNLEYQKTLLLLNQIKFLDSGIMAFVEDDALNAPVAVAHFAYYSSKEDLLKKMDGNQTDISRIVTHISGVDGLPFGLSHKLKMLELNCCK